MARTQFPGGINGQLTSKGVDMLMEAMFNAKPMIPEMWVALCSYPPNATHTGDTLPDVPTSWIDPLTKAEAVTGYSRVYYPSFDTAGNSRWVRSSGNSMFTTEEIRFPVASANWGNIVGWALVTERSGGEVIAYGQGGLTVFAGDQVVINPNGIGFVVLTNG